MCRSRSALSRHSRASKHSQRHSKRQSRSEAIQRNSMPFRSITIAVRQGRQVVIGSIGIQRQGRAGEVEAVGSTCRCCCQACCAGVLWWHTHECYHKGKRQPASIMAGRLDNKWRHVDDECIHDGVMSNKVPSSSSSGKMSPWYLTRMLAVVWAA